MRVIVYADFNCVYCYLASQRADRLVRDGKADVEWRAVEHRRRLPVTGVKSRPGGADGEDDIAGAMQLVRQQWLALPEPAVPAVIGPDGAIHAGPDGLRWLAGIVGPAALC